MRPRWPNQSPFWTENIRNFFESEIVLPVFEKRSEDLLTGVKNQHNTAERNSKPNLMLYKKIFAGLELR